MRDDGPELTPDLLLRAYRIGVFPMSEARDDPEIFWVDPRFRGVLPLERFHISRSLARTIRRGTYEVTADTAFAQVVTGCADRAETWINDTIFALYIQLYERGHAHSVEVWDNGKLVGGVYGVTSGAAFFGESMFSQARDASKVALAYLTERLRYQGFRLFDTQFITPHLRSLGAIEISRNLYHEQLERALDHHASFGPSGPMRPPQLSEQRNTQTS